MKKLIFAIFVFLLIFIAACQQKPAAKTEAPKAASTANEAAVDDVGNGLSNVDSEEKDLDSSELNELDSGFEDVQGI